MRKLVLGLLLSVVALGIGTTAVSSQTVVPPKVVGASSSAAPSCNLATLPPRIVAELTRIEGIRVTNYPNPGVMGPAADCRVVQDGGGVTTVNAYYAGVVAGIVYIAPTDQLFTQAAVNQSTIKAIIDPTGRGTPALAQ